MFVGVDGCRGGWIAVTVGEAGLLQAACFPDFERLLSSCPDAKGIGVDIPIGLTDSGSRSADREARAFLKGRASSVFNAPARRVLEARSYDEARAISVRAAGKSLSRQSYAILGKIAEVDRFAADSRIREVHPEVSFRLMNGGDALPAKKSWAGFSARIALLRREKLEPPERFEGSELARVDDVLDALAAAWTARRIDQGNARRFPASTSERDASGREIVIWA